MKKSLTKIVLLSCVSAFFAINGCRLDGEVEKVSNPVVLALEKTTMTCSDGLDNDGDTLIDCADPECFDMGTADIPGPGATVCPNSAATEVNHGEFSCASGADPVSVDQSAAPRCLTESSEYVCSDGKDNDGNGYIDCGDNSCKNLRVCCTTTGAEGTLNSCKDGIDNDCNGYIDCADYACTKNDGSRYFATLEAMEYCNSKKCPDGKSAENTLSACSDGIDNDCNGYVDCADYSCTKNDGTNYFASPDAIEYCNRDLTKKPENTEEACSDGYDEDLDGLIDCDDQECQGFDYCKDLTPEHAPRPTNFSTMGKEARAEILSKEKEVCTDGIDNNRNGLIDCVEYRCRLRSLEVLKGDEAQYNFSCD